MPATLNAILRSMLACGAAAQAGTALQAVRVVPREKLFVSEPEPLWFDDPPNPAPGSADGWTNDNWLKSRFHFKFAEYDDGPTKFGVLRVMNDDLVQPVRGFGTHPHVDMEIVTFVVRGELTHLDSLGEGDTLGRGSIQFMTAGSGIRHSEENWQPKSTLRFIQSWILPREYGVEPNYGSVVADAASIAARANRWAHVVSDVMSSYQTPAQINQDCNVYVTELSPGTSPGSFELAAGRQAYMLCVEGDAVLAGQGAFLRQHDAVELKGPLQLDWSAGGTGALLLLFEMAETTDGRVDL